MEGAIVGKVKKLLLEGKDSDAEKLVTSNLEEFREQKDTAGIAALLLATAEVALAQGKAKDSLKAAREAWPLAKKMGDKRLQADVLMAMIHGLNMQGKPKEVLKAASSSMQAVRDVKDPALEASLHHIMASAFVDIDEADDAIAAEEKASKIFKKLKDKQGEAASLTNVAKAQRMLGQFGDAMSSAKEAATMWRDLGKAAGVAACVETIGKAQAAQGNPRNILATAREELKLLQKKGCDSKNELFMMEKVAQIAYDLGETGESLQMMEDMITVCTKAEDKLAEAHATKRAAQGHAESYHTMDALRLAKKAQELFEELQLDEEVEEAKILQNNIYAKRLEYTKAPSRKKALDTLRSFVKAVEERAEAQVKQLELELEKLSGALKEDEVANALHGLFRRDLEALKFLKGHGWDLGDFDPPTIIFMTPHKYYYLGMCSAGMNFGPAFRVVNPFRVGFKEDRDGSRACSVCQRFDTENWERHILFNPSIMDAGIQVQGIFPSKPVTREDYEKGPNRPVKEEE